MIKKFSKEIYNEFEDLFGVYLSEAVTIAYNNYICQFANGECLFDYKEGIILGATYTQGTTENPLNHLITLYAISSSTEMDEDDIDAIVIDLEPFDFENLALAIISAVEEEGKDISEFETIKEMLQFLKGDE